MYNQQIIDRKSMNNRWIFDKYSIENLQIIDKYSIIFIDNQLDWIVRSYYRLDCFTISIAKFYIVGLDWIGNPG